MNKLSLIILIISFLLSFSCYSQEENPDEILGFACGGAGSSTKSVSKVYNYVVEKKYRKITKLLHSKNTAEKFLAIIICEKLAEKGKIKLTQKDLEKIKNSYHSEEFVSVCGGCTFQENIKMSILLNAKEDLEHVREETEYYFKDIL